MGRKKDRYYTIMPTDNSTCYLCGDTLKNGWRHFHHCIYGTANRAISDREGLTVYLCPDCHKYGKHSVHNNPNKGKDMQLKKDAQDVWETKYMKENNATLEEAREAFRQLFGKSYIYD